MNITDEESKWISKDQILKSEDHDNFMHLHLYNNLCKLGLKLPLEKYGLDDIKVRSENEPEDELIDLVPEEVPEPVE